MGEKASRYKIIKKQQPEWLGSLLKLTFFTPCSNHTNLRKNEVNIYCIDCNYSMCPHCLSSPSPVPDEHRKEHKLLQIRRYVYQDVIRVQELQKLVDCSKVQLYTVNSAKVVLLNPRRQSKPSRDHAGGTVCEICRRTITDPNRYCSMACKLWEGGEEAAEDEESFPSMASPTPEIEDFSSNLSSNLSSPAPTESSSEEHSGRWVRNALTAKTAIDKRKGRPRRAPFF